MYKLLSLILIIILAVFSITQLNTPKPQVLAEEFTPEQTASLPLQPSLTRLQPIKTQSRFEEKLIEDKTLIKKETVYKDDPEVEAGEEKIIDEGEDGTKTTVTKITYYEGEQYSKEVMGTDIKPAKDKIISRGTKVVWKTLATPDGEISYWKKLRVYATHYDSHCLGCNDWTAIGMRAGKGVIAVDPKVIKMRSKVYVPGYGLAIAGDTGGAIKGNIIDLGFDDARTAGWRAQFTDIYILN